MISFLSLASGRIWRMTAVAAALSLGSILTLPLVPPFASQAHAAVISVQVREQLSHYGGWQHSSRYGEVWVPSVASGWRPYTVGHWVWTDDGWYWDSGEPFGEIVFHYGRWVDDPDFGWVWVVGDEWAPAWVVWRDSDEDIGWVPAPPSGEVVIEDAWWTFVPVVAFASVNILPEVRPVTENVVIVKNTTIINQTTIVNNYNQNTVHVGNRVIPVNAGPSLSRLPKTVVAAVHAARIVPPAKGHFEPARLDASEGQAIKTMQAAGGKQTPAATVQVKPNLVVQKPQKNIGPTTRTVVNKTPVNPLGKSIATVNAHKPKLAVTTHAAPTVAAQKTQKASGAHIAVKKKPVTPLRETRLAPAIASHKPVGSSRVATGPASSQRVMMARSGPARHERQVARTPERSPARPVQRLKCDPHDPRCRKG